MKGDETASVMFKGVKISNVSYARTYDTISRLVAENGNGYVCLNDVGNIMAATRDEELKTAINEATFSLADGTPLAWYGRLVGCTEIERISGMYILQRMLSEKNSFKHFLLGDTEETISRVIEKAKTLNEEVSIVGHSPPFKSFSDEDNTEIISVLRKADPDIIWVSFGGGRQEKWMHQHFRKLDHGIMIGAGAAFKWLIGDITAPPELLQKIGLQWAYRMVSEFRRDPKAAMEFCKRRNVIGNKVRFLMDMPYQLRLARKSIKPNPTAKP